MLRKILRIKFVQSQDPRDKDPREMAMNDASAALDTEIINPTCRTSDSQQVKALFEICRKISRSEISLSLPSRRFCSTRDIDPSIKINNIGEKYRNPVLSLEKKRRSIAHLFRMDELFPPLQPANYAFRRHRVRHT